MSFKVLFDATRPSAIYYFHNDWWNYKGKPVDAPIDVASTGSSSMTTSGANAGPNTVGK